MNISEIIKETEIVSELIKTAKKQANAFEFHMENFCKRSQTQVKDEAFLKVATGIYLISFGMNKGIEYMGLDDQINSMWKYSVKFNPMKKQ